MRMSRSLVARVLGAVCALTAIAACRAETSKDSPLSAEPEKVVMSKQCEQLLVPIREYMLTHTSPIDETVRREVRVLADEAYTGCTPAEFRSFADTELMGWARTVGTVPTATVVP
jgi:hypothetical protein